MNLYPLEYLQRSLKMGEFCCVGDTIPLHSSREYFDSQRRDAVVQQRLSLLVEVPRQKSVEIYRPR